MMTGMSGATTQTELSCKKKKETEFAFTGVLHLPCVVLKQGPATVFLESPPLEGLVVLQALLEIWSAEQRSLDILFRSSGS